MSHSMSHRALFGLLGILCLVAAVGCGGDSSGGSSKRASPFFVTGSVPADGETEVEPLGLARLHFSMPADPATLTAATVSVTVDEEPAPTEIELSPDGQTAEISIGGVLPPGAEVVLVLDEEEVRNLKGRRLNKKKGPVELRFTIESPEETISGGSIPASLTGRFLPAATRLSDGRVLMSGGLGSTGEVHSSAEVIAADASVDLATGNLTLGRWGHAAARMIDGRVLTAGGFTDGAGAVTTSSVEIYDPATGTFEATGSLVNARGTFSLLRTADGVILAIGGAGTYGGNAVSAQLEAWDPFTRTFVVLGERLPNPVTDMATVALDDGKVLVAGGIDNAGAVLGAAHLVDALEDEVNATGDLVTARRGAGAVLMKTGEVLVAGGEDAAGAKLASMEIYDPAAGTFRASAATLSEARSRPAVVSLANGTVAIVGGVKDSTGQASDVIDVYDPSTDAILSTYRMSSARTGAAVVPLDDGRLLVAYGARGTGVPPATVLDKKVLTQAVLGARIAAPRVVSVSPLPSATGVDVDARIRARISKAIDPSTVAGCFGVTDEEGKKVHGSVSTAERDTVVVFTPDAPLGVMQRISVEVGAGIRDRLGNPLHDDSSRKWSFVTIWDMVIGAKDDGSQFGSCTRAGDINGDGIDDIVISAYVAESAPGSGNKQGQVYVIFGKTTWGPGNPPILRDLSTAAGAADLVITAESAGDQLGMESSLGIADINGDGYDDIVVGAHFADGPTEADSSSGELFVIFGQSSFPSRSLRLGKSAVSGFNVLRIYGGKAGDKFGESVAFGDVDGDGYTDIVTSGTGIDATSSDTSTGGMYVIFGGSLTTLGVTSGYGSDTISAAATTVANLEILGEDKNDRLAWCVGCGDIDGDGYADVVGGATGGDGAGNSQSSAGDVVVVFGASRSTLIPTGIHASHRAGPSIAIPACVIHGELKSDFTGWSVDVADLDGDGKDDIAMGARLADGVGDTQKSAGDTIVVFGDARSAFVPSGSWGTHTISSALSSPKMLRVFGENASDNSGDAVLIADADGDGKADLLIGTTGGRNPTNTGGSNIGEVSVLRSSAFKPSASPAEYPISRTSMPSAVTLTRFYGRRSRDRWGTTLAVGDFNGDGHPDLLTGANLATGLARLFSRAGEAYVLWGRSTWWK